MFAGMACCGFGAMIGFGGGIFMVPLLVTVFDVPIPHAIGACAIALFPSSIVSSVENMRQRLVDFSVVALLEVPTALGAIAGAYLTNVLPVKTLEVIFATFVLYLAYKSFRPPAPPDERTRLIARLNWLGPRLKCRWGEDSYSVGVLASVVFGSFSGLAAGIFGIGGGFLKMPIMLGVFGMPARVAVATALAGIVITSLVSSISHARLGNITLTYATPTVLGFVLGAILANQVLKKRFRHADTRRLVAIGLGLAGVAVLANVVITG